LAASRQPDHHTLAHEFLRIGRPDGDIFHYNPASLNRQSDLAHPGTGIHSEVGKRADSRQNM